MTIAVDGRVITNDIGVMLRAAEDGLGLAFAMETSVAAAIAQRRLVRVLAPYCPRFPGLYLYYASRQQLPAKLRALIDFLQTERA